MGKIFEQKINTFNGGISNDIRSTDTTKFAFTRNFDTLAYKHRLVPYRSYESGASDTTFKLSDFLYTSSKLYALGIKPSSSNEPKVYYKNTFTDGVWSEEANNTSGGGDDRVPGCFVFHEDSIFMLTGTTGVDRYYVGGGTVWGNAAAIAHNGGIDGVGSYGVQGIVHSKDACLYLAGTNKIYRRNKGDADGAWNAAVLDLSKTNLKITSICEYGNYLAIACKNNDPIAQTSKVFLWDRDSSVTTLSESIDWGLGTLNIIEELEGRLVGISLIKRETTGGLIFNSILSAKYYAGAQGAVEFLKLEGTRDTGTSPISFLGTQRQKVNNRLYFTAMLSTEEGTQTKEGIWSVGRSDANSNYAIVNEYPSRNDNTTVPNAIDGFFIMGSYVFVAYSDSGTLSGNVSKTDDAANFTSNSKYESLVFSGEDVSVTKKLIEVIVTTRPLPAAGSVTLNYRINENINNVNSTWTTIFTNTTDNSISHTSKNIESTGVTLPDFKEIQFQIISTGNAEITGLAFDYEVLGRKAN